MAERGKLVESRSFHDFRDEDVNEHGVVSSDHEDEYEASGDTKDLPDLYRYLEALDTADTDLDGPHKPPGLFTQPEHKHNYSNIQLLKYEVEEEKVHEYVDEFETGVEEDILVVGKISLEEIQEEEKRLRDEHIAFQQQELNREKLRRQELFKVEEEAKRKVAQDLKEKRRQLARKVEIAKQRERLQLDALHKSFKRAENKLTTRLVRDGADIKTMYGDLSLADGEYGGAKGRRWKLDWKYTPQPVQIKLKSLRGVKDKLPGGRYVLMVSLYDRIGGSVMRWSELKGQQWGGATLPIIHNGNFFNYEIAVNQSVFSVLPPPISLKPSMVLVFELFLLRGSVVQTDRVVSWGSFPICDNNMDLIQGLYKAPFLRSEVDSRIDKHTKIEQLISSDLDHWMCNLYFEVIQLPKYLAGQKEYEVELQFTSDLLTNPEKMRQLSDITSSSKTPKQYLQNSNPDLKRREDDYQSDGESGSAPKPERQDDARPETTQSLGSILQSDRGSLDDKEVADSDQENRVPSPANIPKRPMTTYGSRFAKKERRVEADDESSDSNSEIDDNQILVMRGDKGDNFRPVKGEPGITYKRYLNETVDMYSKKMYTLLPKSAILKRKKEGRRLTYQEKLERHHVSVKTEYKDAGKGEGRRHMEHVRRQFLSELGLSNPRSTEFWAMIIVFVVTFFIRIYIHYVGQWLFLMAQNIPINGFVFLPYTVQVMYRNTLLHTVEEIIVVGIGPLAVFLIFSLSVMFCACTRWALGSFPLIGHKCICCLGLQAVMDPFFIAIVDAVLKSWDSPNLPADSAIADFSKMYWLFVRTEGTGLGGIFVTIFIYMFTVFLSGSVLYMYFLRLYNNGRMLDIYWRLHAADAEIYTPYDMEVSLPELDLICKKAEQWRGEEGERRKVSVYEYEWEEEYEDGIGETAVSKEKTTHLSIHTVHLDGLRELYRHFLVAPDGAIVEVFGESSAMGEGRIRTALTRQSFSRSEESLHKVKGRQTVFTRSGFREDTTLIADGTSESRPSSASSGMKPSTTPVATASGEEPKSEA